MGTGQFTLLTGLSGQTWAEAAQQLALPYLRTVVIGQHEQQDPWCDWQHMREIEEDGALLVRPDGYVAWRRHRGAASAADARRALTRALEGLLAVSLSGSLTSNARF